MLATYRLLKGGDTSGLVYLGNSYGSRCHLPSLFPGGPSGGEGSGRKGQDGTCRHDEVRGQSKKGLRESWH